MFVLSCIPLGAGCAGTDANIQPNNGTAVNLVISDPDTADEELALLIDFVSYRITCPASGLTPYDDSIDLNGNFEVDFSSTPPIWELTTDIPLSNCVISLWVFYQDQVVCSGSESLLVVEDDNPLAPNKANVVLECSLSVNVPSANVDVDGGFQFIHGNYCPKVNWLGPVPVAGAPLEMIIETSAFDIDSTCGLNCDPQTCDFTQNPPLCTAAPDPGFSTTLIAPAGYGSFDAPIATGTPMTGGTPIDAQSTYTCDPLFPGPTEICVVVSDGDNDCDQIRCITVVCPDLCEGVVCADNGDECTREYCNQLDGQCVADVAPDGIACADCSATCLGGSCTGPDWVGAVSGSNMVFSGLFQNLTTTLVNPYSGESVLVSGPFRVNNSSYEGVSSNDFLYGTNTGDFLLVEDPIGTQRICGVENVLTQSSFDAVILANEFIVLGDMVIDGGNQGDIIWANVGNDTIYGQNGVDTLDGGPGDDIIFAGLGNDVITLWPGSGFDSIDGGTGEVDTVEILGGIQSQILILPAPTTSGYEFDIFYLGTPMAQITEVELIVMDDASIDLTLCTGGANDVCNLCGNDALNGGEECDDGNNVDGDGCAADCTAEY
jgi:cysteine-rich repeat protein